MSFEPRDKKKDQGPQIKRDEHNKLDVDHADQVVKKLTEDLITTQRDYQKEMSFKHASNNKRDIVLKTIIYQRNTVNGMLVKADYENPLFEKLSNDPLDPFRYSMFDYIDGEISVREMPLSAATVTRFLMGMYKAAINYLARMNVINRV